MSIFGLFSFVSINLLHPHYLFGSTKKKSQRFSKILSITFINTGLDQGVYVCELNCKINIDENMIHTQEISDTPKKVDDGSSEYLKGWNKENIKGH